MKYESEFVKKNLKEADQLPDFNRFEVDVKSVLVRLKPMGDTLVSFIDKVIVGADDGRMVTFHGKDSKINLNKDYITKVKQSGKYIDVVCKGGLYYVIELR